MTQLDLIDTLDSAPYQKHSATSKAAAEKILPKAGTLRRRVYDFIQSRGEYGATDKEMQMRLDMPGSTQRPRRIELLDMGLIKKADLPPRGRSAVWVVK